MTSSLVKLVVGLAFVAWQVDASTRIAFIYPGGESTGPIELRRAIDPLGIRTTIFAPGRGGENLADTTDLTVFDLVFVDGATEGLDRHATQLATAATRTPVVVVNPTAGVTGNVPLDQHPWIARYWANQSQDNYAGLARYLVARVLARVPAGELTPPIEYPTQGFYHPDAPRLFESAQDYLTWYPRYDASKLTIGLFFNLTTYQQKDVAHIDALIRAIERRGQNAIALAYKANPSLRAFLVDGQSVVDTLLFAGSLLNYKDRVAALDDERTVGVPILGAVHHAAMTADDFAKSTNGLHPGLTGAIVEAERDGRIEPIPTSGRGPAIGDRTFIASFPQQIEWRVDRALAWARLRRASNATKRVVFTYWSEGGGKANIGGDPDDFLDVPASIARLLRVMKDRGYDVGDSPIPDRDALARRMSLSASNVGTWAPGELAARVQRGEVELVPEAVYRSWFDQLPSARRHEIIEMWGPPPGKVMVYTNDQRQRFLVIPTIAFGNILLAPHPDWGYLQDNKALMSTGELPPHHQYVAFFLWLQRQWHADAWVSLFTNISLQPGKSEGPAADDHVALLVGAMPHIHPERLGANGGLGNKRKTMAQTIGWYNIVAFSERSEKLFGLRALLLRYDAQQDSSLRSEGEALIRDEIAHTGLDKELGANAAGLEFPTLLGRVREHLDALDRSLAPHGSKVLGDAPDGTALDDMVSAMLGRQRADSDAERALARDYADRLRTAPREVDGLLEALDGRWVEPGPMDEPVRQPDSLPPGRALYNFNQAAIPTTLAFVMFSGEIAKNLGVTEAQILHLLGARAVRDVRGDVTGIELIPREALGRPRVDVLVTTSGTYRDHYQDKIELIAEATRLAAASAEADNPVAAATRATEASLRASGESEQRAATLARARVFSPAPGAYSPNIQFLAKSGDQRGDEARMAELYTSRFSHAYGAGLAGDAARQAFEHNLSRVDAATLPRSSNVNGMLDQPMSAGFLGGLNLASKAVTGKDVDLYVSNLRDASKTSIESADRELQHELRTRYFNRGWLAKMKANGYDGARNMMFLTDNLDLWDSTATRMVSSGDWAEVKNVYVNDSLGLDLDAFFDRYNPHAQQVLLANLLGAASRGHWNASSADLSHVAGRLAESAAAHGAVCEASVCRNPALTKMVGESLANVPGGASLAAKYRSAIERATTGTSSDVRQTTTAVAPGSALGSAAALAAAPPAPVITGRALDEVMMPASPPTSSPPRPVRWWALGAIASALVAFGWLRPPRLV